jgi:predicted RNA polymerase sigma factor
MAQRISRGKQKIKASGIPSRVPPTADFSTRLGAALHVLYLIFNEGYTATSGWSLQRTDLSQEAIRLTRAVHDLLPKEPGVAGLLALMLLTDARRAARTRPDGGLVPLAEQDRVQTRGWPQRSREALVRETDRRLRRSCRTPVSTFIAIHRLPRRRPPGGPVEHDHSNRDD